MNKRQQIDEAIMWLHKNQPEALRNNTECCLGVWRKLHPHLIGFVIDAATIRKYPPETITRRRRHLLKGTKEQFAEEVVTRNEYSQKPYNQPLITNNI